MRNSNEFSNKAFRGDNAKIRKNRLVVNDMPRPQPQYPLIALKQKSVIVEEFNLVVDVDAPLWHHRRNARYSNMLKR